MVLFVGKEGGVGGERDDGARGFHAEDLWEGLDGVQALPARGESVSEPWTRATRAGEGPEVGVDEVDTTIRDLSIHKVQA